MASTCVVFKHGICLQIRRALPFGLGGTGSGGCKNSDRRGMRAVGVKMKILAQTSKSKIDENVRTVFLFYKY